MNAELDYRLTIINVLKATGIQETPRQKAELLIFAAMVVLKENGVVFNGPRIMREAAARYDKAVEEVLKFRESGVDEATFNPKTSIEGALES